jgi:hypothetical protein
LCNSASDKISIQPEDGLMGPKHVVALVILFLLIKYNVVCDRTFAFYTSVQSSLSTHMYHSEGVWINLLTGEYEVGQVSRTQGGLIGSMKTSVLSMPHTQCTTTVKTNLNRNNPDTFKSLMEQQ